MAYRWMGTLALLLSLSVAAAESPASWLPTEGKSDDWLKATAKCRDLLGKLKPDDPLVAKHLPNVRDKAGLLRRTDKFDWKTITAVEFLESMLADLAAGTVPNARYAGKELAVPYWSEKMNRVEAIWVHVPPAYDPAKSYQLFMCYKCGGGISYKDGKATGGYRPTLEAANQTDTFFAWSSLYYGVKGRMGVDYELAEAVPAIAREFSVDPDRVFLTGYSDGGFTDLWLASRYPHLVAGIAPECANWQYSNVNQVGLLNVPMLVVDGWSDGGFIQRNITRWHTLHTMGSDAACLIGHHGHTYDPYEDPDELKQILDWAKTKRRNLWPKRVRYATWNLAWHRAFWLSIERMANPSLAAQIDAEVKEGNRIEVQAWNVAAFKLTLSDKLVDPAKPVVVLVNGKEAYSGPFKPELAVELVKAEGKFAKSPAMPGDITAQITRSTYGSKEYLKVADRPWLWVKPSGGDAKLLAKWTPEWAKADTEITDADIARCNLFVFGGPDISKLTARIAADLPVKFGKGRFAIGKRVYGEPTECVKLLHPNPLNPARYVIVYAFNDAAAFAANDFFGTRQESAWGFRSGDCVVMGIPAQRRKWGVDIQGGAFTSGHFILDSAWRPPDETPVGELAAPFDYIQILRLRADAIREATGADAGLINEHTPSWCRWGASLPAGPVTLHDLATIDMFPEYVTLCDVRGDVLPGLVRDASAATPLADLAPDKTYRAAMGYHGLPAYRVEPSKLPKVIFFRTPEEFVANPSVSLPVRNMRQLPLEVTEAVAAYIKKRGKVAPRPETADLAAYIQNPEANDFGACDWLHLGADVAWESPETGKPLDYRYTLALGLRAADEPDQAPPRKGSKAFLDLDLAAKSPARFDFAALDKKLPVVATATVKSPPLAGAKAIVVEIRLANRGPRDVTAVVALAPSVMQRVGGFTWPESQEKGAAAPWYFGFRTALGEYKKPTVHEDAALLLFDGAAPKMEKLVARNAGYNFGLVGIAHTIHIKAGGAASLPVLFIAVDKPADGAIDLPATLERAKAQLSPGALE